MATKEANRLKYEYNKKYQDAYWERKAQKLAQIRQAESGEEKPVKQYRKIEDTTVSIFDNDYSEELQDMGITVCRNGNSAERYIAALEEANKCLSSENRRLTRLLVKQNSLNVKIKEMLG